MNKKDKYRWAGSAGLVIFLIFLIITLYLGLNDLSGRILGVLTLFAGFMGFGTFVKPDIFGPLMTNWLDNFNKTYGDSRIAQSQTKPVNSPQVVAQNGNVHINQHIYSSPKKK